MPSAWFDEAVGIAPSVWSRLRRLQRALAAAATGRDWAAVAQTCGYFDQAHLCREFAAIVGVSPAVWRRLARGDHNHVPVAPTADPSNTARLAAGIVLRP